MGRIGCLSLMLTKSLAKESRFEVSCAVVSQVVSFVSPLLSLKALVGCRCTSRSSSHLLGGSLLLPTPFLLG